MRIRHSPGKYNFSLCSYATVIHDPGHKVSSSGQNEQTDLYNAVALNIKFSSKRGNTMKESILHQGKKIQRHAGIVHERPRTFVEELDARIETYVAKLSDFEVRCSMPNADEEALLEEITMLNDAMLQACAQFEQDVNDPLALKQAQVYFREKTHPIMSKSYGINRFRTWPQGQQGDFMSLEIIYKNMQMSEGIGLYLDKYAAASSLGVGVRERVVKMRDLLKQELINKSKLKVLDVACGSGREVFELAPEIKASGAKFTCVDLDPAALEFALDRFAYAGLTDEHTELIQYNALRMFDLETAKTEFGMQDVIYSIGFFDYLPDDFLVKLLRSLYLLLNPGGKLIAAFKDVGRYQPQFFHWFVDWDGFLQRNEKDFDRVLREADIPYSAISMTRVDSGSVVFYSITKQSH
jgi:SAM-dependent methyltransferase